MSKYQFPPLKDEKEFEDLINDLCTAKYDIEFQVYGRKGQGQDGIDGLSFSRDKKLIVYQCKNKLINRNDKKIQTELLKDIEDEVKNTSVKFTNIDTFIFANSFKQDTFLQDKASDLTIQYGFTIIVWSWEEIEKLLEKYSNVAKQYYPEIYDKSILSYDEIKQKFNENSVLLLSSASLYIEKSFIDMPEFDKALEFINKKDSDDNLLVITGKAGIGKTALLSQIQNNLIVNKMAYLSIKSDKFDIEDKDSFSNFFGVNNILHSIKQLSRKEKVVILIDQLDALTLTMPSNQKTINLILEFIEQVRLTSNAKIIVSIREYDLKNDPLFKSLNDSNIINTQLLSLEYVNTKLKSYVKESTKLNNTLIELLRTPLHLIIFIELYPNNNSCISIKTLQDLYNKFWEQKVNNKLINKDIRKNIIELLSSIVQKMNKIKKIEVPILYFENEVEELTLLFSNGILKQENNKISFFHQTFYDYVFAKDFMKKGISLFEYILTTSQDLSIREQFKQIIQFLRGTEEEKYLLELENILYSDKIRFHIKLLLISYLGSLENPSNEEFIFIQKLFKDMENFEKYFIESWISSDWLIYLKNASFFSNENFKKYNLHYKLETFVNKEPNLVLEILDNCEFDSEIKDEAIMSSLERLEKWDEYSFDIFSKYHYLIFKDNTRFILEKIYKKVYAFNEEYAINLFFNFLDIKIEKLNDQNKDEFLNHDWYEIFEFLIETDNINILERLLSSIEKISTKFKNEHTEKEFLITDQIFDSTMWQVDDLDNSTWSLYKKTLEKVSQLALDNKDVFLELIKPYQNTRYLSLITFLIFAYSKNPNEYKNEILVLFTNLELLEEIPFNEDNGYELALLLNKSFKLFNEMEQKEIFNTIIKVNPKWQKTAFLGKWDNKPVYLGTYRDLQKYELLSLLNINDIKNFNYHKNFLVLQRKFHWNKLKKPHKSKGGFVGTPLEVEIYNKMTLDNWLQSMKVFDGKKSRKNKDFDFRGGRTEHYRQFEKEVTENPNKFFDLLIQLKYENIHPDYLSAGLNGLISAKYDEEKVLEIIYLYSNIENIYLKRTILKAIKYLISKDKFDEKLIDILEANKNVKYEGLIRKKDKFQTIYDHISSAINSFEGDFAELLPLVYKHLHKNTINNQRILDLINEVINKNVEFVIFGLLRTLGNIEAVDKNLFAKLFVKIIEKDKTGQISIYSLQSFHYLYLNNFLTNEELIKFIEKCIDFTKSVKDREDSDYIQNLGMYLFYYYLNRNDEIFEELLNIAIDSNTHIGNGILHQIFKQALHSKNNEHIKKSKQFILRFKNSENNDYSYKFNLKKMNGLYFIQNDFDFIKSLAQSINIKKETNSFIEYLQNEYHLDTTISERIFELLEELIQNIVSNKEINYYDSKLLIEFILELNTRTNSDDKKILILNLIDKFLIDDRLRHSSKSAIE
jgi:hypothetical protein